MILTTSIILSLFVESESYLTCNYTTGLQTKHSDYWMTQNSSQNGPLKFITVQVFPTYQDCILNPKVITDKYIRKDSFQGVTLIFACDGKTKVYFVFPSEPIVPLNIFGSVFILGCQLDGRQINLLLELTNARYLLLQNLTIPSLNPKIPSNLFAFHKLKGLLIFDMKGNIQNNLDYLLSYQAMFPEMKEMFLSTCRNGTVNTTFLQNKCPNLTFMSITNCSLEAHVELSFSKSNTTSKIDLDLISNAAYYYLTIYHATIPDYGDTRGVELQSCYFQGSEHIRISGHIHYVKVTGNHLPKITSYMLSAANKIQIIILSQNNIIEIENGTFSGQFNVEHLDMSKNRLQLLTNNMFNDMRKLKFLSLAYNNLETLPKHIFSTLNQLETLDLEGNRITNIRESHLPMYSYTLSYINLNYNPFIELPVVIFYIRGLKKVDLKYTNITFSRFLQILESIDDYSLVPSITAGTEYSFGVNLQSTPQITSEYVLKIVDLTGSKVSGFDWVEELARDNDTTRFRKTKNLIIVLSYFRFVLTDNPISCFSNDIVILLSVIKVYHDNGAGSVNRNFLNEWVCEYPIEFRGRLIFDIKLEESYFKKPYSKCPAQCECFLRYNQSVTIVDCRNANLSSIPSIVPPGVIDIWLQNNSISIIDFRQYFKDVRQLLISNNSLTEIKDSVFSEMKILEYLRVDHNLLSYLPQNTDNLDLDMIYVDHNPLLCDCNSLWFKHWMLENILTLRRLKDITCRSSNGIERFLKVADKRFICTKNDVESFISEIIGAVLGMAAMCLLTLTIIFRQTIKVLLYVKFGFHPFDRKTCKDYETIDITFIYSKKFEHFILENSKILQECNICYSNIDFIPGYSWEANIRNAVYHSKCVFILLTKDLDVNIINSTYAASEHKLKSRLDFLIGFTMGDTKVDGIAIIEDFKRYHKLHQKLKSDSLLFWENLRYRLSSYKTPNHRNNNIELRSNIKESIFGTSNVSDTESSFDVFVSYSDEDQDYSENKLVKKLRDMEKYKIISADQIHPGTSVWCGIETCVDKARHTIFVVSNHSNVKLELHKESNDEPTQQQPLSVKRLVKQRQSITNEELESEQSLTVNLPEERKYVFRTARLKTDEKAYNHLIVVCRGLQTNLRIEREFESYFQKYIVLEHVEDDEKEDNEFWKRLQMALDSRPITNCDPIDIVLEDNIDEEAKIDNQYEQTITNSNGSTDIAQLI
ncbi:toll-like receptor 5 [Mytilus edulis]|uniref:toll-like receptor 5 n=1 Tax=Mytilus edulis TaxID=6550 RepID=UPI0039EF993C